MLEVMYIQQADSIVILGGFEPLTDLVKSFYNNGGKIAAICAAPTVFAEIGLLHGRWYRSAW